MKPESEPHTRVLIIGSGVCGLYAGLTLVRSGVRVTILEKESRVGGLAAGYKFGDNFCDFGVHMLHAFNQPIFEDCSKLMGDERIETALDARIRWGGISCRYPLKFKNMLKAMPFFTLSRCVLGLLIAELRRAKHRDVINNAEDALIAFYGAPLYEYFFEEFTHRYWGVHPVDLSAEFIRRKMPRLSAVDVLRKLFPFQKKKNSGVAESVLDQETLHYSKTGSETLVRTMASAFTELGGELITDADLSKISVLGNTASYRYDGDSLLWEGDYIINTSPLHTLFKLLGDDAPDEIHAAVTELRYKPTVVFAILVSKSKCMDGLYTYYRNRCFHRVGEPKNAGMTIKPDECTMLSVETTCEVGDYRWLGSDEYKQEVIADLERENLCEEGDIVSWNLMRSAYGYPIFTNGFNVHLDKIQSWLDEKNHLFSTGRQGGFCYPAMHSAMQMGKDTAEEILCK